MMFHAVRLYLHCMLVVNPLGPSAGRYYRDGDSPGTWIARGPATLGLSGTVSPDALERLLQGRHPDTGAELAARRQPHRRAGWDLILAAPKSVSVLAGLAPPPRAEAIAAAQGAAVGDALSWLDEHACWARREGRLVAGDGLVAARFDHHHSASGDPHLHDHVVLANLVRTPDGRWSALDGSSLWLHRKALSAIYDLSLRHHLELTGLRAGWELHGDGTWDVASVPRSAVLAVSTREAQVQRSLSAEETTRQTRRAARVLTRPEDPRARSTVDPTPRPSGSPNHWWSAVSAAGLDPLHAAGISYPRPGPPEPPTAVAAAVEARLVSRRSDWTTRDVIAALAASAPFGTTPEAADQWAGRFSRSCLPAGGGRLTSPAAGDLDRSVLDLARRAPRGIGLAAPEALETALSRRRYLDPAAQAAVRRLTGAGHGVDVLGLPGTSGAQRGGCEALVAQAAVLDAAREAWTASRQHVAVVSTAAGARRWAALAGLPPAQPGLSPFLDGAPPARSGDHLSGPAERPRELPRQHPASVLIVDRADRLPPEDLRHLLEEASLVPTKVVLVRGGTLPALHTATCRGLEAIDADLGHVTPSSRPPDNSPGVEPSQGGLTTAGALDRIASIWADRDAADHLVGLGPAEVLELNRRAREALRSAGRLQGSDVTLAGRAFAVGDRVLPLRRDAGAPGSLGTVVRADPGGSHRPASVVVDWDGTERAHDAWSARHLGHAYALTPAGLRLRAGPALLLGEPAALGSQARWVELALTTGGPDPGRDLEHQRAPGIGRDRSRALDSDDGPELGAGRSASHHPAPAPEPVGPDPVQRDPGMDPPERGLGLGLGW